MKKIVILLVFIFLITGCRVKYNLSLNSDINTRNFEISVSDKNFKALLIFIDGITDSDSIRDVLLFPTMKPLN